MDAAIFEAARGLVHRHHVHFDVREEVVVERDERKKVGYRVRLWAVVSGARILPGDASASIFGAALRELAEVIVPNEPGTTAISVGTIHSKLYDSRVVPGADEVALDVLLLHQGTDGAADESEERCVKTIRKTLEALGAQQRD